MNASPSQHHDDEEDVDMLRKIAMESLKKRERPNDFNNMHIEQPHIEHQFQNFQPAYGNQPEVNPEIAFQANSFPSARPPRMSVNPNYMRPRFMNSFPPRHQVRPFIPNRLPIVQRQFAPQIPIMPEFAPIPHVNPQFLAQQPPVPVVAPIFPANEFQMEYVETPKARLSPRTLKFIEENEEAIKKASSKRYSRRSHSGSPAARRRSRSRSPYNKRRSPSDINRKRYRSKSPDNRPYKSRNNSPKVEKRSRSPKNRSQSPRNSRYGRGRGRDGRDRYNGNGRVNNRKRSGSDKEEDRPRSKPKEEAPKEKAVVAEKVDLPKEEKVVEKTKSLTPPLEERSTTPPLINKPPEKKEKTLEELEDELLASTDEEDGDQLDINMDDNELDFLEDDSESENEGRFKSKPSINVKPSSSLPSKSSSYSSKSYDKGKYSSSRNDYKRDDKYSSSRRKDTNESRKKSPERKEISLNKDKDSAKSSTDERKPMFKSTFKSVNDSGEKKADSSSTKKSVTLVRSFVSKPEIVADKKSSSSVKSIITVNEDSSKSSGKKKIMERLGEFVGVKGKEGNRSRATKQV